MFDPLHHENPAEDTEAVRQLGIRAIRTAAPGIWPIAVEIGVWAGATTLALADLGFQVFAVDHWLGNSGDRLGAIAQQVGSDHVFKTFCQNMGHKLFSKVFPLSGRSALWAATWPDHLPINKLYIDAAHSYKEVLEDIQNWSPHVCHGGIIAGHDYGFFPGVTRAVRETGPFEQAGRTVWWREKE